MIAILGMSQVLIPDFGTSRSLLFQDLYFSPKKAHLETSVKEAVCAICQNGLQDGVSITAKMINSKLKLFCQYHFPTE